MRHHHRQHRRLRLHQPPPRHLHHHRDPAHQLPSGHQRRGHRRRHSRRPARPWRRRHQQRPPRLFEPGHQLQLRPGAALQHRWLRYVDTNDNGVKDPGEAAILVHLTLTGTTPGGHLPASSSLPTAAAPTTSPASCPAPTRSPRPCPSVSPAHQHWARSTARADGQLGPAVDVIGQRGPRVAILQRREGINYNFGELVPPASPASSTSTPTTTASGTQVTPSREPLYPHRHHV